MKYLLPILLASLLWACQNTPQDVADIVYENGNIYTVDKTQPKAEAVAVKDGKIVFVGNTNDAKKQIGETTKVIDLEGKTMIPGLIESHGHIMGLGLSKRTLNLMNVKNYDELVAMVEEAVKTAKPGEWITGRGWHQSKWTPAPEMVTGYQTHEKLSAVSPDNPVYLKHASGHAAFANAKAMEIAGITPGMEFADDGEIIQYPDGRPTGIFSERASGLIAEHMPPDDKDSRRKNLQAAIDECLAHGLTSFQDAGSGALDLEVYQEFIDEGKLDLRLWIMLSGGNEDLLKNWYERGPRVNDDLLTVRAIKLYSDGALGSRGAWLLEEYEDREGHFGNPIMPMEYVHQVSEDALKHGFQVCVHAIGDRANQEVLDQYEKAFKANPEAAENSRFRIEHAQHLHLDDIPRFAELGVIASMQAIHMSSDRPWAIDRLGKQRIEDGAYVWQKLLQSGAKVINGTDAPVEPVSPIASFYASVTRQTLAGTPEGGYEASQKMSREEALNAYTIDAAYGGFQEDSKGSIEVGKLADFTVLSQDIMTVPDNELLNTGIVYTIVGGEIKYEGGK